MIGDPGHAICVAPSSPIAPGRVVRMCRPIALRSTSDSRRGRYATGRWLCPPTLRAAALPTPSIGEKDA